MVTVSCAIMLYKKYRYNRYLLQTEKRYVIEAFWKHCETEKEDSMRYQDWLFDYFFKEHEVKHDL